MSINDIKITNRWRLSLVERRTLLVIGDFVVGLISLAAALLFWATNAEWLGLSVAFLQERVAPWFYLLPFIWLALLIDTYDAHRSADWRKTVQGVASATAIGLGLYLIVYFASDNPLPRSGVAAFLVSASVLTLIWRLMYIRIFTASQFMRRVLVVGAGKAGQTILGAINSMQIKPFDLIGIIDDDPKKIGTQVEGYEVIGSSDELPNFLQEENISDIIVAISGDMQGSTFQTLLDVQQQGVEITRMPVAYEELLNRVPIQILEADWILRSFVDQFRANNFYRIGKRILDILGGMVGMLILAMITPFVGLATLLDDGRPVFYTQVRLGRGGKRHNIFKFRTMRRDAEANGKAVTAKEDDERATRVGRFLRKTHIDEIPQFINVLRGDMSLVGPRSERPGLIEHYHRHIPFYRARLLVKPGLTGWAQVNYGYAGNIDDTIIKIEYDLYYVKHRNLVLDIITLLRTPGTMFGMRGQ